MCGYLSLQSELLITEQKLWSEGFSFFVAGIDEAGRGCCAGPVSAAAVMFTDPERIPDGLNDSKQLSPERRMELRQCLLNEPSVIWAVSLVPESVIDEINILRATWLAMAQAVSSLRIQPKFVIVDGNPVKGLPVPSMSIVKGDAKSASIAAASIIAKTERDMKMDEYAKQYPQYGFEIHKGYCTALHTERLRQFGPCPIHRKTFEPVKSIINPPDLIQGELF